MANSTATVDDILVLIKETRIDMKEFIANMEELRASQKETAEQLKKNSEHLKRTGQQLQETAELQKETDRKLQETAEQQKETEKLLQETAEQQKKTDWQLKRTESMFTSQWGKLMESLIEGSLVELLRARGVEVLQTMTNAESSFVRDDGIVQNKEFDILAVNGDEVVAVEVKTTLTPEKVRHFVSALEHFKRYFRYYRDMRVYGAVAYLRSEAEARRYAERQGLFVIRATGDSASIVNAEGFRPREFPSNGVGC